MTVIYDQFNHPISLPGSKSPETRDIAVVTLRDRWSSYPSNGLTPERLARIFREADGGDMLRQAELFEEIEEKDAHIASQFQIRKFAVQGLDWELIPNGESARAKEVAAFCREFLEGLPDFDEHILDLLDALPKGYSFMEILWEVSGGESRIRNLKWVHPKKVSFWQSETPRILTEEEPVRGIDPPPFKFVMHRCKARSGHDTRSGILRVCAWMYLFKNYSLKDWVAFAEVYGMPLRVGKYEPGASRSDREALLHAVRSLGTDAAGIISKSTEIEFIEAQKSSSFSVYESLARFCDAQISKAILGQTLTSDAGGQKGSGGSYALGRVHGSVRQDLTEADCKSLGKTITRQILHPLVGFNFGWDVPPPRFRFLCEPPEDLRNAAATYKTLVEMGFRMSQEHVSERFKVPVCRSGETPLDPPRRGTPSEGGAQPQPISGRMDLEDHPRRSARSMPGEDWNPVIAGLRRRDEEGPPAPGANGETGEAPSDSGQEFIDALAEALNREHHVLDPLLEPILASVRDAGSFDEILETITARYPELDTERFRKLIHQATFAANLWGYLSAREEGKD